MLRSVMSENFMSCFLAPAGGSLSVSRVTSAAAAAGTRVTRLAAFSAASAIAAALWLCNSDSTSAIRLSLRTVEVLVVWLGEA